MHADNILLTVLAEIETFSDLSEELLDGDVPYVKQMATIGVPFRPAAWIARPLSPAERMVLTRATRRLERQGLVQRITEAKRDRVTHLRPTASGLWRSLSLAGEQASRPAIIQGLRRTDWGAPLADELASTIWNQERRAS